MSLERHKTKLEIHSTSSKKFIMQKTSLDTLQLQLRVEEFVRMDIPTQQHVLQQVCGPREYFVYTPDPENNYYTSLKELHPLMNDYLGMGDWISVGMLMVFFRIKPMTIGKIPAIGHFTKFRKVFPFGSFGTTKLPRFSNAEEWLYGRPGEHIIDQCFRAEYLNSSEFELICKAMETIKYTTVELICILRELGIDNPKAIKYPRMPSRVAEICRILEQKRFVKSPDSTGICPFGQLMNDDLLNHDIYKKIHTFKKLPLNRPTWSRQSHGELTCQRLQGEFRQVLLMHKFRRENFALHKDLLDIILKSLFDSYYDDLRDRIRARAKRIQEVSLWDMAKLSDWLLDFWIVKVSLKSIINAVNMEMFIPVPKHQHDVYKQKLGMALLNRADIENTDRQIVLGGYIEDILIQYCIKNVPGVFRPVILGKVRLGISSDGSENSIKISHRMVNPTDIRVVN